MNAKKIFLSFIPWLAFGIVLNRTGQTATWAAALVAAGISVVLMYKSRDSGVKVLDVVGVATFGALAVACLTGGAPVNHWFAHYGRGLSTLVLALVMLVSAVTVPFTEAYARETVPAEHWGSPLFRSINRKISAMWGVLILAMAGGHLLDGLVRSSSTGGSGDQRVDFLLNWVVPVGLVIVGVRATTRLAEGGSDAAATPAAADRYPR